VTAGGVGRRFRASLPKQFVSLAGIPIIERVLRLFEDHPAVDDIFLTLPATHLADHATDLQERFPKLRRVMAGGDTRQASVRTALAEPMAPDGLVCIHDAVRPLVHAALLDALLDAAARDGGAAPALSLTDTVAECDGEGYVLRHVDRTPLRTLQTPQVFRYGLIRDAHAAAASAPLDFTDDTAVAAAAGCTVRLVPGDPSNVKITTQDDLALAAHLLAMRQERP